MNYIIHMECFNYVLKPGLLAEMLCIYYIRSYTYNVMQYYNFSAVFLYTNRFVNVMVTTLAMIVAGANLVIMDQTVANHKFSLDGQLPLTLMKSGKNSLRLFDCYIYMILATLPFWKKLPLVLQTC